MKIYFNGKMYQFFTNDDVFEVPRNGDNLRNVGRGMRPDGVAVNVADLPCHLRWQAHNLAENERLVELNRARLLTT